MNVPVGHNRICARQHYQYRRVALRIPSDSRAGRFRPRTARRAVAAGGILGAGGSGGMKTIEIPELALVALIGASGSGKSTLARKLFRPTEILSADFFRGLV